MRVSSLSVNHGNDVMMAQFSFLSSSQTRDFQAPSQEMGVKNCQCIVKKKIDGNFPRSQYSYQP